MESSNRKCCKSYAEHSPSMTTGFECLAFAEIDEIVRRAVIRISSTRSFSRSDATDGATRGRTRRDLRLALPLLAIELNKPACGFGNAARRNLRDHLSEVRAFVRDAAADQHEVLWDRFPTYLAHTALEAKRPDVMLSASVRAAADADVPGWYDVDQSRDAR
jgi:hypothetical protein